MSLFERILFFESLINIPVSFDLPITLVTIILFIIAIIRKNPNQFLEIKEKIINLDVEEYSELFDNYRKSLKVKNLKRKLELQKKIKFYLEKANIKFKNDK